MAEFARALQACTAKYVKGAANETIQNSILLNRLKQRGRILYGQSGTSLDWRIKTKQRTLRAREDMEAQQFTRQNLYESATLPWRGYDMQDAISEKERLMCRGDEALIQIWPDKMRSMADDAMDQMNKELFVDGNATGYEKSIHGLESIFGCTGTTTAQYGTSSESYAGLSPAAIHGTESATSPYSPQIVNDSYTSFGSWATTGCILIARSLISACRIKNNRRSSPDLLLTNEARYLAFKNELVAEERYVIAEETKDLAAGFRGLTFDGVEVLWDFDCGAVTYCLNLDQIELRVLPKELFYAKTSYDQHQDAHLFSMHFWGNMRINPRYQGKSLAI